MALNEKENHYRTLEKEREIERRNKEIKKQRKEGRKEMKILSSGLTFAKEIVQ